MNASVTHTYHQARCDIIFSYINFEKEASKFTCFPQCHSFPMYLHPPFYIYSIRQCATLNVELECHVAAEEGDSFFLNKAATSNINRRTRWI